MILNKENNKRQMKRVQKKRIKRRRDEEQQRRAEAKQHWKGSEASSQRSRERFLRPFRTQPLAKVPQSTPAHPHDAVRLALVAEGRGADLSWEAAEEEEEEGGWGGSAVP